MKFYTSEYINHKLALQYALSFVDTIAKNRQVGRIVLCANTLKNFSMVDESLNGCRTHLTTNGQQINIVKMALPKYKNQLQTSNDLVISCFMNAVSLFEIDDMIPSPIATIAVPWCSGDINNWIIRWSAVEINQTPIPLNQRVPLSTKAQNAMDSLNAINLTNMVMHESDEEHCKRVIRALYEYEPYVDSIALVDYLVTKHHWRNKLAQQIGDLFQKLQTGKRFKGGTNVDLKKIYERW